MEWVYDDGGRSQYFKGENVGDCVTRAIAIATEQDYKEVYDELTARKKAYYVKRPKEARGCKTARWGVPRPVIREYMDDIGWEWIPTMHIGSGCKVHVKTDELPSGRIVLNLSRHLSCSVDGVLHDTYDCSRDETRCVYGYWKKRG